MDGSNRLDIDLHRVSTPCFIIDQQRIRDNMAILAQVQERCGAKILLALKGFAMFSVFPLINGTLAGTCASSPHEARLGREEFGGEVHVLAAAHGDNDFREICQLADHIVFNSFSQKERFLPMVEQSGRRISLGMRVNPEHSEGHTPIYDPCTPGSRLGVKAANFSGRDLTGISGLHFHTLCQHNADALARTLTVFAEKFGPYLSGMDWVNFGGGHHITRAGYDIDLLCELIDNFRKKYQLAVYLEPGEAVALNAGYLVATVLDIVENDMAIAILDTSATAHMPDILEMPYRPEISGAGKTGEKKHSYRLAGPTCLSGDIIGEYSFDRQLQVGDKLVFHDMGHYTMVKTTTFNGVKLPSIAIYDPENDDYRVVREFAYEDYRGRLS